MLRTVLTTILLLVALPAVGSAQQGPFVPIPAQQIQLQVPAPASPTVSANYIGTSGVNTYYYWVVANYPGGASPAGNPVPITNASTLSATNTVSLSWNSPQGVQTFTLVRTLVPNLNACTNCLLVNATTNTTFQDTGVTVGNFNPANPLTTSRATITIDNKSRSNPFIVVSGAPGGTFRQVPLIAGGFTAGSNAAFDANGNLVDGSSGGSGLADPGANGVVVRTALNTTVARTITAGTGISVANGDGVAGNPTITNTGTATVASFTAVLGTSEIASEACAPAVTVSATGTLTTDAIIWTPNADITAVTGYVPVVEGGLSIYPFPTVDNVNFIVCNPTAGPITPGAVTLNGRVVR